MPNPRLSLRIPPDLMERLPQNEKERSQFVIDALLQKLEPATPEDELAQVKRRLEVLERRLG